MKIGILTGSVTRNAGGTFEVVSNLARQLQHNPANEVSVFGLRDEAFSKDLPAWGNVPVSVFSVRGPRSFGYTDQLYPAIRQTALDLLHIHGLWMYPSVVASRWRGATGAPTIISPHGMLDPWALANSGWKKKLAAWAYENRHLNGATCIHALCDAEAAAIRRFGLKTPVCVIPNGIVPADLAQRPPAAWRATLPANAKVALYLGRLHPKKGLPGLLAAWAEVKRSAGPQAAVWHLAIAGWDQGGHGAILEDLVAEMALGSSVHFIGPQFSGDKTATYQASDAFILPSLSEGLPVVVLEAWSHGLPAIMTTACNLEEGFAARAAIRIAPGNHGIASALRDLFEMPADDRRDMGRRGRKLVSQRFTWPRIAVQMESVYAWLLSGGHQPSCVRLH
jgi:glycosyltransferase involved in cell wall biosynthesis